jgi:hypothetical protein
MGPEQAFELSGTAVIDAARRLLADFSRCPACAGVLVGRRCPACEVDLTGPDARRVGELSVRAATALGEREVVIQRMRAGARSAPVEPAPDADPPAVPPARVPPVAPASIPASGSNSPDVHGILVGLGALLLSVAAVGFLVFSWQVLSLPGRAAVIAVATLGVLGTASWLRGRLPETAEAVGALGVVLVLADGWAIRGTGLFGADRPDLLSYAASATAVSAVLLGGWALLSGVRAGSWAAVTLAPLAIVLLAARLDDGSVPVFAIGLLLVAGLALSRGALRDDWSAERWLLRGFALMALVGAGVPAGLGRPGPGRAALVLVAAALLAGVQAFADRPAAVVDRARSVRLRRGWSLLAGLLAGTAAAQAGSTLVDVPLLTVPVLAVVAAAAVPIQSVLRRTAFAAGAVVVAGLTAIPVLAWAIWLPVRAGLVGVPAWTADPGVRFGDLDPQSDVTDWAMTLIGLAVVAAGAAVAARIAGWPVWLRRPVRFAGAAAAGSAVVVLPLMSSAPVVAVVAGLLLISVTAAGLVGSGRVARVAPLLLSGITGTLAVLLAWSSRELSVPVTLLGIAGLLLARRLLVVPQRYEVVRAALGGSALLAAVVVVGALAGLAEVPSPLWIVWAGAVGGLSVVGFLGVPRWWPSARSGRAVWTGVDRLAAALPGLVALVLGLLATVPDGPAPTLAAWPRPVLLAVALLIAAIGVGAIRPAVVRVAPVLPLLSALMITGLLGGLAASIRAAVGPAEPHWPALSLLWAVAAAVGALVTAAVVLSGWAEPGRRIAAELGAAGAGLIAVSLVTGPEALWPVLLVLGAGAAAIATTPDRTRIGWLAGLLLMGSTWTRLALGNVTLVEAYSVPPALALLMLALYRFRRDRTTDPVAALLPVATVGLTPSILAAASGPALRPAVLIGLTAVLVIGGWLVQRDRPALGPVLAGIGVLGAGATGLVRAVSTLWSDGVPVSGIEAWTLPATAVLVVAALVIRESDAVRLPAPPPLLAAVLLFAGPTLAAALLDPDLGALRAAVVLGVSALTALAAPKIRPATPGLASGATAVAVVAALTGLTLETVPAEAWTGPVAVLLLLQGRLRFAAGKAGPRPSWSAFAPGLIVLLLPSLYLGTVTSDGSVLRTVGLITLAGATLVFGAIDRLQAPVLLGAVALGVQTTALLMPWLVVLSGAVPVWGWLAVVGLGLIVFGARYEVRIRQLRAVGLRLTALR